MNCKPGDLAILVRSAKGRNTGKICTVLRAYGEEHWLVEFPHPIDWSRGEGLSKVGSVPDAWLRPIRPGDLQDEESTPKELEAA